MKILILAEYVRRYHWMPGAWVPALARGLAARGHDVTVAVDGTEDPALFAGSRLLVRRPHRTMRGSTPLAFQRWAMELVNDRAFDSTLSLTTLAPGAVWAPVGGSFIGGFISMALSHAGVSAVLETIARPWLPAAALAERRAKAIANKMGTIECRIGMLAAPAGVRPLGYASIAEHWPLLAPVSAQASKGEVRGAARRALGLDDSRPAVVVSAVHPRRPGFGAFLGAIESLGPDLAPAVLVLGRKPYSVERLAKRHGGLWALRFLGPTAQIPAVMAAADLAASPWSRARGATSGRFVADALRHGRPVLAHMHSPGAELIEPSHFGTPEIGTIVREESPVAWAAALRSSMESLALGQTTRAARDVSGALSLDGMCARLEAVLREAARH